MKVAAELNTTLHPSFIRTLFISHNAENIKLFAMSCNKVNPFVNVPLSRQLCISRSKVLSRPVIVYDNKIYYVPTQSQALYNFVMSEHDWIPCICHKIHPCSNHIVSVSRSTVTIVTTASSYPQYTIDQVHVSRYIKTLQCFVFRAAN